MVVSFSIDHGGDPFCDRVLQYRSWLGFFFGGGVNRRRRSFVGWIFLALLVPSLVPSVTGFSFIRFSGFLWVIDGPTNAVAIDPLIVVMVPGYSESELFWE